MSAIFSFSYPGMESVVVGITRMAEQLGDMTPLWDHVRDQLQSLMTEERAYEGDVGGIGGWEATNLDHPILYDTGRMFDSLEGTTGDTVYQPEAGTLVWGTLVDYAHFHQDGTSKMPARVIFDHELLTEAIGQGVVNGARANGIRLRDESGKFMGYGMVDD